MSAFICGSDHIKALAVFAVGRRHGSQRVAPEYFRHDGGDEHMFGRPDAEIATYYANIMYCENIRSVQVRYPSDSFENLPGPCEKAELLTVTNRDVCELAGMLKPIDIIKMCDCLEYQSCESDDWQTTLAYRLLLRIRRAAWHSIPEYENAPWEWERPVDPRKRSRAA